MDGFQSSRSQIPRLSILGNLVKTGTYFTEGYLAQIDFKTKLWTDLGKGESCVPLKEVRHLPGQGVS